MFAPKENLKFMRSQTTWLLFNNVIYKKFVTTRRRASSIGVVQRPIIFWLSTCNNQLSQMFTLATYEWIDYWIIDYSKLYRRVEFWIINDSKAIFMNIFSPFALKKLRSWHTWLWLRWTTIILVYAITMYHHGHNNWQNNHEISDETNLGVFKASHLMIT
jgi:hypothetical protein